MKKHNTHFVSTKVEARENLNKGHFGLFAKEPIRKGELLVCWGGKVLTGEQLTEISDKAREHSVQVEENLYQVSYEEPYGGPEAGDYINHSCEPNAGLSDSITVIAMRDIEPDEEICFDYAMSDSSDYDEFVCACGTPSCRRMVTGSDWRLPQLQAKYGRYFSPYLQRRIAYLQAYVPDMARANGRKWETLPIVMQ